MKDKENKRKNSGRPKLARTEKLVVVKGSIEFFKLEKLKTFDEKKLNEKQVRDYLKFCTNFAYKLGSYEKAIDTINNYETNNSTDKQ